MIRAIVEASLRFRLLVLALAAGITALGVTQVRGMPVDSLPEFTPPMVEVQTEALGLSAAEVEQLVTVPLEQDLLSGVAFLDEIESVSLPGLSSVVMTFEPGTDLLDARQVVQERLTQAVGIAGLPEVAKPPQMIQPLSSQSRVSMVKLSSASMTPIEVSVLGRWVIGPRLMGVPGVANVTFWGNRERQLQVRVDPERLRQRNTTLSQVIATAGNALEVSPLSFLEASKPGTGGFIDTLNQRLNIFHEQAITSAAELAQVPLDGAAGTATPQPAAPGPAGLAGRAGAPAAAQAAPPTLGDVSEVVEDHQPLIGDAVCANDEDCLLMVVEKLPGANTVEVTAGVESALAGLRPGLGDMQVDSSIYRPASFVESSLASLGWALLVGGLLLLVVLGVLLRSWRRALIAVAAVVVSLAAALLVLILREVTLNVMVVAGLVLGLTAVIAEAVTEACAYRRSGDRGAPGAFRAVVETAAATRTAAVFAVLIVAAAALPAFFMGGEGGAFLPAIVLSYLLAVATAMAVALTVTPVLALTLVAQASPSAAAPSAARPSTARPTTRRTPTWVRRSHERLAGRLVPRARVALALGLGLAVVGLVTVPFLDASLRPVLKERQVLVHIEAAPGTSLPRMTEITDRAVRQLGAVPGVTTVGGHVGRAVMSDERVDVNSGEIWVGVDPGADYDATVSALDATMGGYPEVTSNVSTYSEERVTDVLQRSADDVVVRIYGEDPVVRDAKAEELRALLAGVDGVAGAVVGRAPTQSTMQVEVDLKRAQAAGIKPGDVRRAAASLLSGITVGNLFQEQKVFDVVVWGAPQIRQSEDNIEQLLIDAPGGRHVRLGDVANVRNVPNPAVIRHESVSTYLDVTADVAGRGVGDVASDIEAVVDRVQFPLEHHAEVQGAYADRQADQSRLLTWSLAAAVAIFLLLQAAFRSWRLALLAFATLPLALVGAVAATVLTGGDVTLGSLAGLLGVLGLAARGVVGLIRYYQHLERREGVAFGHDLVMRGRRDVAGPVLVSAVAIGAVLVPVALAGDRAGFELLQPLAVTVLGGLITATLVTLLVVPGLYSRFGYVADPDTWADDLLAPAPGADPALDRV